MHFNGIYIKAQQISSWVLDVRGSKKPFRHTAGFLIVKIDGALFIQLRVCVCDGEGGNAVIKPCCRHCSGF